MTSMYNFRKSYNNDCVRQRDFVSVAADNAMVTGRTMINGAGESFVSVDFPVRFSQLPSFSFGFEMKDGEVVIDGQKPTGSAVVTQWKIIERLPFSVYYTGAVIQVVTTGPFYQKMLFIHNFSGMALSNPSL